jgi:hypothetical protein
MVSISHRPLPQAQNEYQVEPHPRYRHPIQRPPRQLLSPLVDSTRDVGFLFQGEVGEVRIRVEILDYASMR